MQILGSFLLQMQMSARANASASANSNANEVQIANDLVQIRKQIQKQIANANSNGKCKLQIDLVDVADATEDIDEWFALTSSTAEEWQRRHNARSERVVNRFIYNNERKSQKVRIYKKLNNRSHHVHIYPL